VALRRDKIEVSAWLLRLGLLVTPPALLAVDTATLKVALTTDQLLRSTRASGFRSGHPGRGRWFSAQ